MSVAAKVLKVSVDSLLFLFLFFFSFSVNIERFMLPFAKALPPFPKVKHAPVKFVLAEFAGICIVLTNIFFSVLRGFQKQALTQGRLTNLLCNKTCNSLRKG